LPAVTVGRVVFGRASSNHGRSGSQRKRFRAVRFGRAQTLDALKPDYAPVGEMTTAAIDDVAFALSRGAHAAPAPMLRRQRRARPSDIKIAMRPLKSKDHRRRKPMRQVRPFCSAEKHRSPSLAAL